MSYDPYGISAPQVNVSGALGIDPATGQPIGGPPPSGLTAFLGSPLGMIASTGAVYGANKYRKGRAAKGIATDGVTRGTANSVRGLASQGQASRAGMLRAAISRNPSAALQAMNTAPTAAAAAVQPGALGQAFAANPLSPGLASRFASPAATAAAPSVSFITPAQKAFVSNRALTGAGPTMRLPGTIPAGPNSFVGSAAASTADDVAGAAARTGLARFAPQVTTSAARMNVAGLAAMGSGMLADQLNVGGKNSAWDQALTGGAALGVGGGIIAGPLGAGIGALVGAGGNLAYNAVADKLWRDKKPSADTTIADNEATLTQALDMYGFSPQQRKDIMANYGSALLMAGKDDKKRAEVSTSAASQMLAALPGHYASIQGATQQRQVDQSWQAATQAFAAPYLAQQQAAYETQAQQYERMAAAARSPEEQAMYGFYAANARQAGASANASFAQQSQMMPQLEAQRRAQAEQDALMQQAMAAQRGQIISGMYGQQQQPQDLNSLMNP